MPNKTVGITFFSAPCYNYLACDINVDIMMNIFDQEEPTKQGNICMFGRSLSFISKSL